MQYLILVWIWFGLVINDVDARASSASACGRPRAARYGVLYGGVMTFCFYISDNQRLIIWISLSLALLIVLIAVFAIVVIQKFRKRFVSPDIRKRDYLISYDPGSHVNWTQGWHSLCHRCQLIVSCGPMWSKQRTSCFAVFRPLVHFVVYTETHSMGQDWKAYLGPSLKLFSPGLFYVYTEWLSMGQDWRACASSRFKYFSMDHLTVDD